MLSTFSSYMAARYRRSYLSIRSALPLLLVVLLIARMPVAVVAGNVDCEVCYSDMIGTVVTMVQTAVQRVDILAQMSCWSCFI